MMINGLLVDAISPIGNNRVMRGRVIGEVPPHSMRQHSIDILVSLKMRPVKGGDMQQYIH